MQAKLIDERDNRWESGTATFRVYISADATTETFDLTDGNVLDAIAWAQRTAGPDRTYAVALVVDDSQHGRGLVWLIGTD